ncbi:MAG: thioredoxin domain-containing protein [Kiloniellales bacterium]|nr:thioredoxin domain-containing protein [Kiloniellales bacterium]
MSENRLAGETSPYLLQHKDNPVHWYPWGEAAFAAARDSGRPVLLSVGYAACHWCHVMAHESFEDEDTAAVMNELFVNIKVDREERPDLDTIYQSALALLGEQGGWPLTMFLTADGAPFWGGTYFPPAPRFGRPAFEQVLRQIAAAYREKQDAVAQNADQIQAKLAELSQNLPGQVFGAAVNDQVAERLVREFDPFHGGLGHAPKFPQPSILKLIWRAWKRSDAEPYRKAVETTLIRMSQGGIYDHLGGGYARYAVDNRWLVPHFEKMLYDNAQLIELLTWAWQETGDPLYETRVRETVGWALREMIAKTEGDAPSGAFASSYDADSEGEEGKFYVWQAEEIDRLLGPDAETFKAAYDVTPGGNWEGHTILNRLGQDSLFDEGQEAALSRSRNVLFEARAERPWPGWDDKVLADWNGLMIAALARAAAVFGEPGWLAAAQSAFRFVTETMTVDGRLRHAWRRGKLNHPATLDDYANLCEAALALHEVTGLLSYIDQAVAWLDILDAHYWDSDSGGYFLTAADTERLIVRTKTVHDNATPAGNGTLAGVLARLYHLTGEHRHRDRAEALIGAFAGELQRNIFPLATLLNGVELLENALQVVVLGDRDSPAVRALLAPVTGTCLPNLVLQVIDDTGTLQTGHPARGKARVEDKATVYLCRGTTCSLPITDPEELARALAA